LYGVCTTDWPEFYRPHANCEFFFQLFLRFSRKVEKSPEEEYNLNGFGGTAEQSVKLIFPLYL